MLRMGKNPNEEISPTQTRVGDVSGRVGDLYERPEDVIPLTIPREEFERLSTKTREILSQAALAQERITKDQQEIELLKEETRLTLTRLRAA
jgi:hypothetical protein